MAYAALISISQTIDSILNHHQYSISPEAKNQIISIDKFVMCLQTFLEDFPDKSNSLEGKIQEETQLAEDIMEFLMLKQIHKLSYTSKSKSKHQTQRKYAGLRYNFRDLKKATKKIESIIEEVMEIKERIKVEDLQLGDFSVPNSSSRATPIQKDVMVGFDKDLMEIKSRLCGESSRLEVVPIVGMGGAGKTTLVRNAYDDLLITDHFEIRAWVTVSQEYSVNDIVSGLVVSMKLLPVENDSVNQLNVYKNLKRRRYLIVLDDVWSKSVWDDLKMMFPDDGNGSRIMLTTRLSDVASYADSYSPVHEMRLLDKDQSWNLLRWKVFKHSSCPCELEFAGKMIARSCKGLPLAVVVISGILIVDQTKSAWERIMRNVKYAISASDEQFQKILSLSYTHLPHHLRPCFLYMGGLPKRYEMHVAELIKLWVAEGFLKPDECGRSFEETAEEYLEDLVKRSLVFVTKRKSNGRIKRFSLHDLVRDMCIRKALEEKFFIHVNVFHRQGLKFPRRVSTLRSDLYYLQNVYGSTVRTVVGVQYTRYSCLKYFRYLRILDLVNVYALCYGFDNSIPYLPDEVFELLHLRYLAFDYPFRIPAAISNLQYLQTIIIPSSKLKQRRYRSLRLGFLSLPLEIWSLKQLRHLVLYGGHLIIRERAMPALENLQTLSVAVNFVCSEKIVKMVPNLKKLGISYTGRENEDYQLHNLIYLQQLEDLKLKIGEDFLHWRKLSPVFPSTLKELSLNGWRRPWKELSTVGSLPNLEVLKLREHACVGRTWETTEGEFSQLKYLLIDNSGLQQWITESSHFPRLKCLVLRRCRHTSKIPDGIGEVPTLELIDVDDLNASLVESAKQIQEEQRSWGNDSLHVHFVCQRLQYSVFEEELADEDSTFQLDREWEWG